MVALHGADPPCRGPSGCPWGADDHPGHAVHGICCLPVRFLEPQLGGACNGHCFFFALSLLYSHSCL
ncbi:hypothetical protein ID866_11944 [Astraeus odoratus]|nr:hypothetical protein ID866_11944 [Astraeus odoratus]